MISDLFLVALPLHVLWHIKMPIGERRLILTLFSSSVLTFFGSLVVFVMWYGGISLGPDSGMLSLVISHIEVGTQVIFLYIFSIAYNFFIDGPITPLVQPFGRGDVFLSLFEKQRPEPIK